MFSSTPQGKAPGLSSEACSSGSPGDLLNTAPHIESSLPLPNRYLKGEDSLFLLPDSALRAFLAHAWLDFGFEGGSDPSPCLGGRFYGRKEIEEAAGLSSSTAHRTLSVLVEEGIVEQRDR